MPLNNTYLLFSPDESGIIPTRSSSIWVGERPIAGEDMPDESIACVWLVINGDTNPLHYWRNNQNTLILYPEPN